jgi:hypothetical protein
MALCINKTTGYGVTTNYFKIANIEISFHSKMAKCELIGFISKEARDEGKEPLMMDIIHFFGDDFTFNLTDNLTEVMYSKIKLLESYQDATDC